MDKSRRLLSHPAAENTEFFRANQEYAVTIPPTFVQKNRLPRTRSKVPVVRGSPDPAPSRPKVSDWPLLLRAFAAAKPF
jgi:hypothetical protein